ncbi:MAG TPA: 50S ribosomal protein L3 [Sedimentisphaerales bacterium]|nr:50S ribosomal protein L3 [Sedimentisphaerales bacterium]
MILLGKKIGMTQVYDGAGKLMPVTVIQAGPCTVLQIKTAEKDGYHAVQLGYGDVKPSRVKKPLDGHAKKAGAAAKAFIREMKVADTSAYQPGSQINVSAMADVKFVDIIGTSKGKGFAGAMKRHNFGGFGASHGTERKHRAAGSLSSFGSDRGHGGNIKKGKKMAGHMGAVRVTTRNHKLVSVDAEKHLIVVKGAVPGAPGSYVVVRKAKTKS